MLLASLAQAEAEAKTTNKDKSSGQYEAPKHQKL
jgi:hypothetical protein